MPNINTCAVNSRRNLGMRKGKWNPCINMRFRTKREASVMDARREFNALFKSQGVTV